MSKDTVTGRIEQLTTEEPEMDVELLYAQWQKPRDEQERLFFRSMDLLKFAGESDRIEGISDEDSHKDHAGRLGKLIASTKLTLDNVCEFNTAGELRLKDNMNVRIGNHIPPRGGQHIVCNLEEILDDANKGKAPWDTHCRFEGLHPFTDGNGRTGRAIWLWQMLKIGSFPSLGFLHTFYCQTLWFNN